MHGAALELAPRLVTRRAEAPALRGRSPAAIAQRQTDLQSVAWQLQRVLSLLELQRGSESPALGHIRERTRARQHVGGRLATEPPNDMQAVLELRA